MSARRRCGPRVGAVNDDSPRRRGLLHGVFDSFPDAVVVADAQERIVLANSRCREVFGHDPHGLIGRSLATLVPDARRTGHSGQRRLDLVAVREDGARFAAEVALSPIELEGTRYTAMTVRDVSEHHRLQQEADRMRDDLVATVSHELRTPLTSIVGYTELLMDLPAQDLSPTARRLLDVVARNATRELRLVDDLLTLAFLGQDQMPVVLGPVDLGQVVRAAAEAGEGQARRRGLTVEVDVAGVAPVRGDVERLAQVVDNLLANAVKFTPSGGRVDLRVLDGGDAAVLEVADTGPGVPPDDLERIFDRLYRTADAVSAHVPGAGLGLPIVRAIIEAHGGVVEAFSTPGNGTLVRARVPYASSERTSTTAEVSSGP